MIRGVYAITPDICDTAQLLAAVESVLQGGVRILQYRNKLADAALAIQQATALRTLCNKYACLFIINDDVELALQVAADGVHLGGEDGDLIQARQRIGSNMLLGASCYNDLALAHTAVKAGVDYVAFGAMFASSTKPLARRASLELLAQARAEISLPIVTIGGITLQNAPSLIQAGADSIALISALFDAPALTHNAQAFSNLFHVKQTN